MDGVFDMNVKLMSTMYKDEGVVVKEKNANTVRGSIEINRRY